MFQLLRCATGDIQFYYLHTNIILKILSQNANTPKPAEHTLTGDTIRNDFPIILTTNWTTTKRLKSYSNRGRPRSAKSPRFVTLFP